VCVLNCEAEHTAAQTWDTCTCKPGWTGPTCSHAIPYCPSPEDTPQDIKDFELMRLDGVPRSTFIGAVAGLAVAVVVVGILSGVGVYCWMRKKYQQPSLIVQPTATAGGAYYAAAKWH